MIRLHPFPDADHICPYCQVRLEVRDWHIPGMRNLADLKCPQCKREFYGDLPAGHGLYYPMLLEQATGKVHDKYGVSWFAKWLHDSYLNRVNLPLKFTVEELRPLKHAILLNCLDTLYGHCLLKLLNAQYYIDHCSDFDLIVLIPHFLRWMVPDKVAAIWTVDLPLKRGTEWNDWLADQIKNRINIVKECHLSVAFSHPHPSDYDIERFTRVRPFPIEEWGKRLNCPTVTFIWREDRIWWDESRYGYWQRIKRILNHRSNLAQYRLNEQKKRVIALAEALHQYFPNLDFAVAGLGHPGGLPNWIADLRTLEINEQIEKAWCERYAQSHVVVGVHGSNMLLPSAHAGAVVELVPPDYWKNLIQDILMKIRDIRETIYRHRFLPSNASAVVVAEIIASLLRSFPSMLLNFDRPWCDHKVLQSDPWIIAKNRLKIADGLVK